MSLKKKFTMSRALLLLAICCVCNTAHAEIIALKMPDGQYRRVADTLHLFLGSTIVLRAHPAKDELLCRMTSMCGVGKG